MIRDQVLKPYLLNAYKQQITDNDIETSWTDANEKLAFYLATKIKHRMKQHFDLYQRNDQVHKFLMYPVIALTTIVGTVNFNTDQAIMKYVISSINIANALLLSYIKFSNLGQLSESHNQSYIHYDLLYRKIIRELVHEPRERSHASEFLKEITERYDDLLKLCPTISDNDKQVTKKSSMVAKPGPTYQDMEINYSPNQPVPQSYPYPSHMVHRHDDTEMGFVDTADQKAIESLHRMRRSRNSLTRAEVAWERMARKLLAHTDRDSPLSQDGFHVTTNNLFHPSVLEPRSFQAEDNTSV